MKDNVNKTEDLFEWMGRLSQYENAHECPKIGLTREEIVTTLKGTLKRLAAAKASEDYTPFEKRMLFVKYCIVRQILDDLLCIPNEIRPWTADETKWLAEMTARENAGCNLSKPKTVNDAKMEEILRNISE